jgi:ATP-binding cassette, subfamily B, multidrug efflux pump
MTTSAGTVRRLLLLVRVHRSFARMFAFGLGSIALNLTGPLLLGRVTNLIFAGVIGREFRAEHSKAQVVAQLRRHGHGAIAALLRSANFVPGRGIDLAVIGVILLVTLVVYALSGFCWILQGRQATTAIQDAGYRLRTEVEAKLARLPPSHFDASRPGELLSRATNDIDNVIQTLQQTMSQLANSLLLVVGLLAVMFWISPLLAVIALLVVPAAVAASRGLARRAQPQFAAQWTATGQLNAHIEEMYAGHAMIKAFEQRDSSAATFRAHNEAVFRAGYRAQFVSGTIQPSTNFMNNVGYVLVAVGGCLRLLSGALSIGEVQAFIQYSRQLSGPLTQMTSLSSLVQSGIASARRVFELLDATEETPDGQAKLAGPPTGLVRFESVSFRYAPPVPLIDGLSLTVEPGTMVAIVGATGAGKTTLVNLLMRFYEVDEGRITIDGVDIASMPRRDLRSMIGLVLQDTWLFTGTIADNIGYGRPGATRPQIEAAAISACADHFIQTLPSGYDTVIDEESSGISAGERQLITIARAFLADPPLLVLDEASSSVDPRTEVRIRQAVGRLRRGRTSFVIAHRLSTIRDADTILVMDRGAVVAAGTHAALLDAGGVYDELYRSQFPRPTAEVGLATA